MFIERFVNYLKYEKRLSAHTLISYQTDLAQFHQFLEKQELQLTEVNHFHVRSWVMQLMDAGIEARTVNHKISTLCSFYKFLLRESVVDKTPMTQIKALKMPKRLPVVVEDQKLSILLDQEDTFTKDFAGLRDRVIIELLFGTGVRLAELLGLKDSDVEVYEQQIKVLGKRSKERIIPLTKPLLNLLQQYIQQKQSLFPETHALIVTDKGQVAYSNFVYRLVKEVLSKISTQDKKSPHVLRHTFATSLLNKGADLNAIKELLGHANLSATQIYTHNSVERLKSVYKQAHPKA